MTMHFRLCLIGSVEKQRRLRSDLAWNSIVDVISLRDNFIDVVRTLYPHAIQRSSWNNMHDLEKIKKETANQDPSGLRVRPKG